VVHDGETNPTLVLFHDEAWFHLRGHLNSMSNSFSVLIHEVSLYDMSGV